MYRTTRSSIYYIQIATKLIILKVEVSPRHGNSNFQTLKKVQNLRKTTPPPLSEGWLRAFSMFGYLSIFCISVYLTINKKLSCRREAARFFMSLQLLLSHSMSFKIIRNYTDGVRSNELATVGLNVCLSCTVTG